MNILQFLFVLYVVVTVVVAVKTGIDEYEREYSYGFSPVIDGLAWGFMTFIVIHTVAAFVVGIGFGIAAFLTALGS